MSNKEFNSLDDFERFVKNTITPWSPEQRIALAASMVERWLPIYQSFSEDEEWGDPALFERAVQSVWKCVLGDELTPKDRKRYEKQLSENTPHPDDFACETDEVIATSAMTGWAINACGKADNIHEAVMAMVCGFEALAPNIHQNTHWNEIEGQLQKLLELSDATMQSIRGRMEESLTDMKETTKDDWRSRKVQNELKKQMKLLKLIGDMTHIDQQHIKTLRPKLVSSEFAGAFAPRPEPVRGLTNEAIFEQYRRRIERDVKGKWHWEDKLQDLSTDAITSLYFGEWMARYKHRKDAIEQGPMLDVAAHDALLARYAAHDAAVAGDAGWDQDTRFWIEMPYKNPDIGFDVNSPEEPHSYGPSLRRLWIQAKQSGDSDMDVWNSVLQWARHQPPAWEEKKKQGAYAPELSERLTRELSWRATEDVDHPWTSEVGGETWRVRLNDFPDDLMYTLLIDDAIIGKFHDWPEAWQR